MCRDGFSLSRAKGGKCSCRVYSLPTYDFASTDAKIFTPLKITLVPGSDILSSTRRALDPRFRVLLGKDVGLAVDFCVTQNWCVSSFLSIQVRPPFRKDSCSTIADDDDDDDDLDDTDDDTVDGTDRPGTMIPQ